MSTLLAIGLANAICAALLAVPAFLASRHGRRPALAHALWLLVLLKLVTPPLFRPPLAWLPAEVEPAPIIATTPAPLAPAQAPAVPLMVTLEMAPQAAAPAALPVPLEGPAKAMIVTPVARLASRPAPEAATEPPAPAPAEPAPPPDAHDPARSALGLLVALWLAGALFWLARSLLYVARFRRLVLRHARPADEPIQQHAHELAARLGLRRSPPVWLIPGAVPPMVWGLGRAVILFPAGLLEHLGADERASLLLHELAHVRRRDHWVRWLELAALCLFWWYPLAWWARGRMLQHEEECCDAWAAAESSPRAYAAAILDAVDFLAGARPRLPAVASPLAGVASLKQRLTLILTATPPRQLGGLARLGLIVLAVAVLPLVPTLARSDKEPAREPPEQAGTQGAPEPTELAPNPVELLATRDAFSVQFSRDGKFLAVGVGEFQRPGEVQVFDVPTRKPVWRVGEPHGIASVSFTADSKQLAWSGWGGRLRGRDVAGPGGGLSLPVPGRNFRLAHSPDGRWLAAAGEDRLLQLREPRTGKFLHALRGDLTDFYCVTFSPDSKVLAAGGGYFERERDNFAVLFDVTTRRQVAKLEGHTRAVLNVAFAPKSDLIATSSYDTTVRLWDGKTFRPKSVLRGHTGGVKGLAFSPDGKTLATGSFDRSVRLWDVARGQEVARLDGHPLRVREVSFSPDGGTLASVGGGEAVKLWDVKGRKLLTTLREAPAGARAPAPVAMALSPDGKALALGTDNGRVVLRDPRTSEVRLTIKAHDDAVTSLSFSRDGRYLATGGPDAVVKVWGAGDGKLVRTFKGHTSWVYSLAFAGDGKALASGSYDRTVRVWPLGPGQEKVLTGHKASVRSLVFTLDGKGLISGGADRSIRVWDVEKAASTAVLKGHEGAVRDLALTEGGKVLISAAEDGLLKRWDLVKNVELASVKAVAQGAIRTVSLSPAGRVLAAGNEGGSLMLYDPAKLALFNTRASVHPTGGVVHVAFAPGGQQLFSLGGGGGVKRFDGRPSPVRQLTGHTGPVRVAVFSPDGKLALSCGGWPQGDKTLRLWEVATGKPLRTFEGNKQQLQSAAFTPDGRHVAAGEDSGVIHLWEAATGRPVRQYKGHTSAVPQINFSADGKHLLSASHDRTVRLWDVATAGQRQVFRGHTDWARAAIFLPDGQRVLTGARDKTVRVWRIADGALLRTITQPDVVEAVAATRDGKRFLAGGGNFVRQYNAETGGLLSLLSGHAFGVTSLALAKDDRTVLTSSYDGSVRAWDLETGGPAYRLGSHRDWVWSVALSPDGRHALTAGGGGQQGGKFVPGSDFAIRLWRLPAAAAVARAP